MAAERVQKILAAAGYGSRQLCEKFIEAGRVRVNGKAIKLGDKADAEHDKITIDGQLVRCRKTILLSRSTNRAVSSRRSIRKGSAKPCAI